MCALTPQAKELLEKLRWGSTWKLFGLAVITYCVYMVYYARRQTVILNAASPPDKQISLTYFTWWFVVTYSSLALFLVYFFVPDDSIWAKVGNLFDRLDGLLGLIWAFLARGRFHQLLVSEKRTPSWFNMFWTFLFQYLYVNFKINQILEKEAGLVPEKVIG